MKLYFQLGLSGEQLPPVEVPSNALVSRIMQELRPSLRRHYPSGKHAPVFRLVHGKSGHALDPSLSVKYANIEDGATLSIVLLKGCRVCSWCLKDENVDDEGLIDQADFPYIKLNCCGERICCRCFDDKFKGKCKFCSAEQFSVSGTNRTTTSNTTATGNGYIPDNGRYLPVYSAGRHSVDMDQSRGDECPRHLKRLSKRLNQLLRHGAHNKGLHINSDGFARIDDVLRVLAEKSCWRSTGCEATTGPEAKMTLEELVRVSVNNGRARFETHGDFIRATRRHTVSVNGEVVEPLYVGAMSLSIPEHSRCEVQPARNGVAKADFSGEEYGAEYLSFQKGTELIVEQAPDKQGWAHGKTTTGEAGWFPFDFWQPFGSQ